MDFGARKVEPLRNHRNGGPRNVAKLRLNIVEYRQKRSFERLQPTDNSFGSHCDIRIQLA